MVEGGTIFLDNTVAEFRRSPAAVVHQDRHHAVVLMELIPEAFLDRSSRDVIELNVCRTGADVRSLLGSVGS